MADEPQATSPPIDVPVGRVLLWTIPWIAFLCVLLILGASRCIQIPHDLHKGFRLVAIFIGVALAIGGIVQALIHAKQPHHRPWYTSGFLVSLVLFWGLFPPAWFFTEYYLLDREVLQLPPEINKIIEKEGAGTKAAAEAKAQYLAAVKVYADLASKVWLAVAAALATIVGLAKK